MEKGKVSEIFREFNNIRDKNPMIFLDYDGTLVPIIKNPEESYPDSEIMAILERLKRRYELYIVTGRSLREIREFIGNRFNVLALHGAICSLEDGTTDFVEDYPRYRKTCDEVYSRKEEFQERYPGVQIINKDGGLVFTKWFVAENLHDKLLEEIRTLSLSTGMELYQGKMIVELRIPGPDKGRAIHNMRGGKPALIVGDDLTDEDAFRENPDALTIHIGKGETAAKFTLENYIELRELLVGL